LKEETKDSRKLPKTRKKVKRLSNKENPTPEPHSHDQETECIICGESFDEEWIQFNTCKDWAHEACVDTNSADLYFNCNVCVAKKTIWSLNNMVAGATRRFSKEAEITTKFEVVFV
jgi:hypothetical protein